VVQVFRPWFGRVLTIGVAVVCGIGLVATAAADGADALVTYLPWLLLVAGLCWALFWRPCVEVSDAGVRLVNVTRTIDVPWPAIEGVETRWALTLRTAYGRFSAWAAPAPGRAVARKATLAEFRAAPRDPADVGVRVGDLESSDSGEAATLVRRRWDELRAAGHLDDPRLEHERVPVRWHVGTAIGGALLVALGVVGIIV
jgi:hypothetical protein